MESQRNFLMIGLLFMSMMIWFEWNTDQNPPPLQQPTEASGDLVPQATQAPAHMPVATDHKAVVQTQYIDIQTDTFLLKIDPRGGDIVYAALRKHQKELGSDEPFVMLDQRADFVYTAQSGLIGVDGIDKAVKRAVYASEHLEYMMHDDQNVLQVTLKTKQNNVVYKKQFIFTRGQYDIGVKYIVENQSNRTLTMQMYGQLKQTIQESESSMLMPTYRGSAFSTVDDRFTKYSFEDMQEKNLSQTTQGGWVAMIQHYFVSAWVPQMVDQHDFYSNIRQNKTAHIGYLAQPISVAPYQTSEVQAKLFIGL